jgi:hypothetical protein
MPSYFNPENPAHITQLHASVDWSIEQLAERRKTRLVDLGQYVGPDYSGENVADDSVPINMIELGVNILQRFLSSTRPQVDIGSEYERLLPSASDISLACNFESNRINLADTFNTWTIEALFCMGTVEVGLTVKDTPPDSEGYQYDPGHLFVDPILFDNNILDMCAKRPDLMFYRGHDYTVPLEWVKENEGFDKVVRESVTAPNPDHIDRDIASESLSHDAYNMETLMPMITLRQLWIPSESLVLQFVVGQEESSPQMPLKMQRWEGPERGMYHDLCFGKVPGNLLPNAPVRQWAPLHDQLNRLWNKITDQGDRQKTLLLIRGAAAADGKRIVKANDGDALYSDDPGGCKEWTSGGANPQTFALALQCKEILDQMAGNLSSLGGLGKQSDTLGQDKLIAESASGKPQNLQELTLEAERKVFEDMSFWLKNDPVSEYQLVKQIGNTNESIEFTWGPADREAMGELTRYNYTVDPFNRPNRAPSEKANDFIQFVMTVLAPNERSMVAQNMAIDWEFIVKTFAKFKGQPDIRRAIRYIQGENHPLRGEVEEPGMAATTTRNNVRHNVSDATARGKTQVLISSLMGAGSQPSEMASLARPA